jgi:hypothetical protein
VFKASLIRDYVYYISGKIGRSQICAKPTYLRCQTEKSRNFWVEKAELRKRNQTFFSGWCLPMNRVTRLGEFSPIGRLFSLASLLKITEVAQLLFPHNQLRINFDKKLVGQHFGRLSFHKLIWSPCP